MERWRRRAWIAPAAATAVVTATLLALKPVLHHWLQGLEQQELYAGLRLLLISVVLLLVLPNQGYGTWQAFMSMGTLYSVFGEYIIK